MTTSTLLHTGEEPPKVNSGHGTAALGPSDSSDSGSDVRGGPGFARDLGLGLETGSTSDPDRGLAGETAGPDLGDADLDSDTDAEGTGERAAAGRDATTPDGQDISVDRVVGPDEIGVTGDEEKPVKPDKGVEQPRDTPPAPGPRGTPKSRTPRR
jgi:hypothetical protein